MRTKISLLAVFFPVIAFAQLSEKRPVQKNINELDSIIITTNIDHSNKRYGNNASRTERILENIPGISLVSRGNYAQEAIIRGMSDGQTMLTINGMHIFGACTDKMDPSTSYIEPNNLQQIRYSTSPAFGLGGANIGGGLQFMLKEAKTKSAQQWSGLVATQYETNGNGKQLLGQVQYSSSKLAILLDGIYRSAENYKPGGKESDNIVKYGQWSPSQVFTVNKKGEINFSQYNKWNLHLNAAYQFNEQNSIKLDYLHDDGYNIGYPALSMDVKFAKSNMIGIHYIKSNNNKRINYWETAIYYNKVDHSMDDTKRPIEELSMHMDMPAWSQTYGAFTQMNWLLGFHDRLKMKVEAYQNKWHAEMTMYPKNGGPSMYMLTIPDAERKMVGLDLENQTHIDEHWLWSNGAHVEYNNSQLFTDEGKKQYSTINTSNSTISKGLYNIYSNIRYSISELVSSTFSIARSMRSPTLRELYAVYLFNPMDNYDYIGNPLLKPETSWNLEWQWNFKKKSWNANVKFYSYFIQNYIAGMVDGNYSRMTETATGVKRFGNISNAIIAGTEISFQYKFSKYLSWNSNNSYGYGRDNNHRYLPLIQSFRSNNILQWNIKEDFQAYIENLSTIRQNNISAFYGEKATPGFAIFHIGTSKSLIFNRHTFNIDFNIRNIFNKYYYEHLDVVQLPRQGRNFQIRLAYQF